MSKFSGFFVSTIFWETLFLSFLKPPKTDLLVIQVLKKRHLPQGMNQCLYVIDNLAEENTKWEKKKPSKDLSHEEHLTDSCGPLGDQLLFAKVRNGICGRVAGMKEGKHYTSTGSQWQ